ncbi:AsmA family protein [Sphingomonas immobilis]|uniref:AsmA family protein n=1 Tax=Sphingomonas immobilis TaxID=3063997 RepID=A0ABT8ZXZ6_9SPHN|nr:AsmA family protein [Sphingomonas sp. CA1-15]MDO7841641.1 AsmA family protein [Sphingomonas sp. CA1-15]
MDTPGRLDDVRPVYSDEAVEVDRHPPATPQPPKARRGRGWRIARNVVLGVVLVLFLIWLVLYITKGRFLKHPFERITTSFIHRDVKVRGDFQLFFDPITIKFLAEGMTVSNPAWASKPNLFEAGRIDTRIAPLSLIWGKKRFHFLDLSKGAVDLEWDTAHKANTWTFDATGGGKPFELPIIQRAMVAGTTLRYRDPQMRLTADLSFQPIRSQGSTIEDAIRFSGDGVARDTPFTLTGALLSPNDTVNRGKNELQLTANAAHNVIDVSGTLPGATDIETVPLAVRARGRNAAELLGIIGVAIPQTRGYTAKATLVKAGDLYSFTHFAGRFGASDLGGTFSIRNIQPRLKIDAALATRSLDIVDVAPFIGYNPDVVATKGAVAAAAVTGAAPARLLPDANLRVEAIKNFDADVRWTVKDVRSRNVPISNIDLTVSLVDRLLKLSPFTFSMARGNVAADIVMDERRAPMRTDYDIRLAPTPMGRLLAGYGVDEAGTTGVVKGRIKMTGTGDTLHDSLSSATGRMAVIMPQGTMWARNVQISELDIGTFVQKMFEGKLKEPVHLNCGLIGFTVRDGIAAADPILIDTQKNVIVGRGGFSFRSEALDLAFRADGKKISLFSGQSPVGLNGSFAKPGIAVISPQLLARAGAGVGLGVLAPPAALLAFVDIGDAKATQCGPVLAGAAAAAQRTKGGKPRDDVGRGTTAKAENGRSDPATLGTTPRK